MVTNNSINLQESGIASYDGAGVFHGRTLAQPAAGITISNANGTGGNPTFALSDDLAALEALATTGIAARTASSTWATRTITAGTGISISNGDGISGNPTISATAAVPILFTEDSGTATPSANNLNILGTSLQGITTSGSGATVTITAANGTTAQKGVLALATNAEAINGTDTAKAITADDLKAKLGAQTNHGLPIGASTTAAITWTSAPTNGQLLIGSTGNDPALGTLTQPAAGITITGGAGTITFALADDLAAVEALATTGLAVRTGTSTWTTRTITAGSGITISNGDGLAGNPTISVSGTGFTWTDASGSFTATANNGYFLTAASTPTLPASPSQGDAVSFICDTASTVTVTANTGQRIRLGTTLSASAGTAVSSTQGSGITLIYRSTGATWIAQESVGIWNVT